MYSNLQLVKFVKSKTYFGNIPLLINGDNYEHIPMRKISKYTVYYKNYQPLKKVKVEKRRKINFNYRVLKYF